MKTLFFLFVLMATALTLGISQTKDTAPVKARTPAHHAMKKAAAPKDSTAAVRIVNTNCPISGDSVKADGGTYTYHGKTYGFCCPGCIAPFKKDPEQYIKSMQETENTTEQQPSAKEKNPW